KGCVTRCVAMTSALLGACVALASMASIDCGGARTPSGQALPPQAVAFPALRFAPDKPSYLVTAKSVQAFQATAGDLVDSFGMLSGVTRSDLSHDLERLLAVDPLSAEGAAKVGIDPNGGVAMFSEGLEPTFAVHLSQPETTQGFFDHLRDLGIRTQSV